MVPAENVDLMYVHSFMGKVWCCDTTVRLLYQVGASISKGSYTDTISKVERERERGSMT